MIVVTGAAGFIGSSLVYYLNSQGEGDIVIVDDPQKIADWKNLEALKYREIIPHNEFLANSIFKKQKIRALYHLGACSDTTETDSNFLNTNNTLYTNRLFQLCSQHKIPFCYASSAATYGAGSEGYNDEHSIIKNLKPLNKYGLSKQLSDEWILQQRQVPPKWFGIKFFNVYGPNEYHKNKMSSVVFQTYQQIKSDNKMKLFKSYHPDFKDGEQLRDFVYVKDVVKAMVDLINLNSYDSNGIYNMGTGQARTFLDLARATFKSMGVAENIEFIDMPENLKNQYQYYTQAVMTKFHKVLPEFKFHSLEDGIKDYVQNYLIQTNPYLNLYK